MINLNPAEDAELTPTPSALTASAPFSFIPGIPDLCGYFTASSYLTYTTPPLSSALRCQPMGTWTGTACLSSPASQSFPPFIAPLVLRSTPRRYFHQTSNGVSAMRIMFRLPKPRWGMWREGLRRKAGPRGYVSTWNWWAGRVRRAHGRPYPATLLNGAWTSITEPGHSQPSGLEISSWGGRGRGQEGEVVCAFQGKSFMILFSAFITQWWAWWSLFSMLGGGIPMVPAGDERKHKHQLTSCQSINTSICKEEWIDVMMM